MAPRKRKAADDGVVHRETKQATTTRRITRGMTTDASIKAVLNTTELLEGIFMHLPNKEIFASQRVCRQVRDLVQSSARIQQKLFLRLSGQERQEWDLLEVRDHNQSALSPFRLRRLMRPKFLKVPHSIPRDSTIGTYAPVRLNHLFEQEKRPECVGSDESTAFMVAECGTKLRWPSAKIWTKTHPSWRKMFFTDPPSKSATLDLKWFEKPEHYVSNVSGSVTIEVKDVNGLQLGTLLDASVHADGQVILDKWYPHIGFASARNLSLAEIVAILKYHGTVPKHGEFKFDPMNSTIKLNDVVIPTEEEWEAMK